MDTVSSKGERTRHSLLDAATGLLRQHGPARVTMADVAEAAGVTRQALYLHFANRAALMVALTEHVGAVFGAPTLFQKPPTSARAREVLATMVRAAATYAARVHEVALALDLARHTDADADAAWNDRMTHKRRKIRAVVQLLDAEGSLRKGWGVERVVDVIWAVTAPRLYTDLVVERRWSQADYERFLLTTVDAFLAE